MNCLVLGGNGFIGRNLCETLAATGHSVRAFDLFPLQGEDPWPLMKGISKCVGDFTSQGNLESCLDGIDVVFHLISTTTPKVSNENPLRDLRSNVETSLRFLDLLVGLKRSPRLIFFSSGGTVYGIPEEIPIREDHVNNPLCAYGLGKLSIEKYLALYRHLHGLDYTVLRLANPYGKYQNPHGAQGVVTTFLSRALCDEPFEIWGDGTVVRDYLYIDDVCFAVLQAMAYDGPERIFNIGSGRGVSLNELIEIIRELTGLPVSCRYLPGRACDVPVNVLDITRAASHLGWSPRVSLYEGLERLLNWMKEK